MLVPLTMAEGKLPVLFPLSLEGGTAQLKNVQKTVKASIVIPSTSNVPVKTSHYANPTTVPTGLAPYISMHKDVNGTVFIAVGTIILSFLAILIAARFFFWLKNRRDARSFDDIDDYYGRMYDYEKSIFGNEGGSRDEKSNGGELTLDYDSQLFTEGRNNTSSDNSYFSNHSSNPSTSSNTLSPNFKPGRMLRNGSNQINPSQMVNIKRASYISPINELVNADGGMSSYVSLHDKTQSSHRKSSSISLLLAKGEPSGNKTPILGAKSMDNFKEMQNMVEQSLVPETKSPKTNFKKGHSRPPSVILDLLLQDN